jgi:hypothetical protein
VVAPDDPLSDLPVETLLADPDGISPGEAMPAGYVSTGLSTRAVAFELGRLLTNVDKFFFNA